MEGALSRSLRWGGEPGWDVPGTAPRVGKWTSRSMHRKLSLRKSRTRWGEGAGGVKPDRSRSARHPAWRRTPQRRVVEDTRDRETLLLEIGDEWGQLVCQVDRPGAPGAVGIAPPAWPMVDQGQSFVTDAGTRRARGAADGDGMGHFRGPSWPHSQFWHTPGATGAGVLVRRSSVTFTLRLSASFTDRVGNGRRPQVRNAVPRRCALGQARRELIDTARSQRCLCAIPAPRRRW